MKKLLAIILLVLVSSAAYADNIPPPGNNNQVIINKAGKYGAVSVGNGLNITATAINATGSPTAATTSNLGSVIVGTGLNVTTSGVLSGALATTSSQGEVIVGSGLSVSSTGVLSAPISLPATTTSLGTVIVGSGLQVTTSGLLSGLPATTTSIGEVVVGSGLAVSSTGVISSTSAAPATTTSLGTIIVGDGLSVTTSGNLSVTGIGSVTTGIHDSSYGTVGVSGSALYETAAGGVGGITTGTVGGIGATVLQFFQASNLLYQITQGMDIDPRFYGAACNSRYSQGGVTTTAGSPVISISGYTFVNALAGPGSSGDVGKIISIFGGGGAGRTGADVGPTTYIASVNTGANTATLGSNMAVSESGAYAVWGGGPPFPSVTPSDAADDTNAIHLASTQSLLAHGGRVKLPTNCLVHNLTLASGTQLVGNIGGLDYDGFSQANSATTLWVASNGFPEDPATGILLTGSEEVRLRDFNIQSIVFPFMPFGFSQACIGYSTAGTGINVENTLIEHVGFVNCPVGLGAAYGYNIPVGFTASISGTTMTVTSIDTTNFRTTYGSSGSASTDYLGIGRTVSGVGVTAATHIVSVPTLGTTGTYIVDKSQTVSSESMTSPATVGGMGGKSRFAEFLGNGIGINGAMSDWLDLNSVFSGLFMTYGWYLGPAVGWSSGNGGVIKVGGRFEEVGGTTAYAGAAFVCDGCNIVSFNGTDWDGNGNYNIQTKGTWGDIQVTGGWMVGGGNCNTAAIDKTMVSLGGTGRNFNVDGTLLTAKQFATCAGSPANYLFSTSTGASVDYISVTGGATKSNLGGVSFIDMANFTNSAVSHYKQSTAGWPYIDTTQNILSATSTGGVGIGTANAAIGTSLDLLNNTTTTNSSLGLPGGTTTNRPTTGVAGMFRYNSTIPAVEAFFSGAWNQFLTSSYVLSNYLGGLVISNDPTTPNTVIDITAGTASADDNSTTMQLATTYTKTTGAWAVGSGNGCLDTGSITANQRYSVFLIQRTDTGVSDILCSTSSTSPLLPTNYTKQHRLDCGFKTNGSSNILSLKNYGGTCLWGTATTDVDNVAYADASTHMVNLNVPLGVSVQPIFSYSMTQTGNGVCFYSPGTTPLGCTTTNPFPASTYYSSLSSSTTGGPMNSGGPTLITNSSGQIGLQQSLSTTTTYSIATQGWKELHQPNIGVLAIDATASATSTSQTGTFTLTTTLPNEPIIVFLSSTGNGVITGTTIQSVSDGTINLSLRKRKTYRSNSYNLEEWSGVAPGILTSDTFTWTATAAAAYSVAATAFTVSGSNVNTIFDTNATLPASNSANGSLNATTTVSTSHGNDMIISSSAGSCSGQTVPSGFSNILSTFASYKTYIVPQTNLPITYTYASCFDNAILTDAIVATGP